jgi:two-component system, response regulator PdtaR
MKILIVDDEALIRMSLARVFRSQGDDVYIAEDGVDGEKKWLQVQPDIVVLDVLMPGLSGPQLIERVKAQTQAKIVLISAYAADYDVVSIKKLGADLFIAKPFENIFSVAEQIKKLVQVKA